jgi:hypothetical protein
VEADVKKAKKKHADGEMAGGSTKATLSKGKQSFADGDMGSGSVDAPKTWDEKRDEALARGK